MKVETPERIWIESDGECPYFYHEEELSDAAPPITEYVRADKLRAEIEALRAEVEDYRKNGAVAVKCAPFSAYWSGELRRLFGDDAREGIDSLEQQYCDSLARVEQLANALKDIRNLIPVNFMTDPDPFTLITLLGDIRHIADNALLGEGNDD